MCHITSCLIIYSSSQEFGTAITVTSSYLQGARSIEVTLPALRVFADILKYIETLILARLRKSHGDIYSKDIKWVLTVPAMWKASARDFMRQAAKKAELYRPFEPRQLAIALEPESAALHIRSLQTENLFMGTAVDAKSYIVVDIGGGTIDVAVHNVFHHTCTQKEYVHELKGCMGSALGATVINGKFEMFLYSLNVQRYPKFFQEMKNDSKTWNQLMENFEICKIDFNGSTDMRVELPGKMFECYHKMAKQPLTTVLTRENSPTAYFQKDSTSLRIAAGTCLAWYQPTIDSVTGHIQSLEREFTVEAIFLVGGFAECEILVEKLKSRFPHYKLVIPDHPGVAVITGAVRYGPEPKAIASRTSYATYGTSHSVKFIDGIHDVGKKYWSPSNNAYYCRGVFSVFVTKGQEVDPSTPYRHTYTPMELDHRSIHFDIYATECESPQYVTDRGCVQIGEITLPIEKAPAHAKTAYDDTRSAELSMDFSGSEIFVTSMDNTKKHYVETTVDYLPVLDYM